MIKRNECGALIPASIDSGEWHNTQTILARSVESGDLPAECDYFTLASRGKIWHALHHEIYDIAPDAIIVCVRCFEGNKYGVRATRKTYHIIADSNAQLSVAPLSRSIEKLAKRARQLGDVIRHIRGEIKISLREGPQEGYKTVLKLDNEYVSIFDGSRWMVGIPRKEQARKGHRGGYYYYRDLNQLLDALASNSFFTSCIPCHQLAICRVSASGRQISYGSGKFAATSLVIHEQIASVLPARIAQEEAS
jgi:hypothetical protein